MTVIAEAFWARVDATGDCWEWLGAHIPEGYGQVVIKGRVVGTHRVAYELANGPIPAGHQIDHLCRNPRCCNPAHLEAVTPRENTMRGVGPTARRARQTHCIRGHALAGDNLIIRSRGSRAGHRDCRECKRARDRNVA